MFYLLFQKKKCKNCGKLSHKDVLFCWLCGCSFNARICVSGHKNPPWVLHCLTCGRDRSLMSQPHTSKDLNFIKHPTKPSTYVPGRRKGRYVLACFVTGLGVALLCSMAIVIVRKVWEVTATTQIYVP
jgi:hypothetical protein